MTETAPVAAAFDPTSPLFAAISAQDPSGKDVSYDPQFEHLSGEIEKLSTLAGAVPDWSFVIAECERVLCTESKDLRAMTWLALAKAQVGGWRGVAEGLALCGALNKAFWPTLYPSLKRIRARAGQLEWLWGAMAKRVTAMPVRPEEADSVRALEPLVAELSTLFADLLKDADPGVSPLRISVREKIRNLPEPVVAPPPPPPVDTRASSAAAATPAAPARTAESKPVAVAAAPPPDIGDVALDESSLSGLDSAQDAARKLRDPLAALARHARRVAPISPWPYRLARIAAWLTVERAPEVDQGKTFLRGPKPQDRETLMSLFQAGHWDALLDAAEDAIVEHVFWLDPHRFVASALDQKGAEYRAARQTVGRELVAFLKRVPGIPRLIFSTGVPFATPETIDWIDQETATLGGGAARSTSAGQASDEASEKILSTMTEHLASGDVDVALGDALAEAERLSSARGRFRVHLAVAKHAQASARTDLALALYERMLPQVNETLEQWEPALSAEALGGLLKVVRGLSRNLPAESADMSRDPRETTLFQRLLAIDPHAALRSRAQ
ncbi:MAG: type VI secretion system protein TssA [Polyangiaceae bacterium]|nr:type VI secretion system protein TssA [Polyangiaceae bacterium]